MTQHILPHIYTPQETGYFCGPGSVQIALTARDIHISESQLAAELPTTWRGTDWIGQVTTVLARYTGQPYVTREMPNDPPTQAQKDLLWEDIVRSVNGRNALVANIVAPPGNQPPGYPANETIYHYFAIVGYDDEQFLVFVSDPANFGGYGEYWLTLNKLASLIPPKGYSAAPTGPIADHGPGLAYQERDKWQIIFEQFMGPKE